jgi:hypothetical protein
MTVVIKYLSVLSGGATEWQEDLHTVQRDSTSWTHRAENGDVGTSSFVLEDPDGTSGHSNDALRGLKTILVNELAVANGSNQNIWAGFVRDRRYARDWDHGLVVGPARAINVSAEDINAQASFRYFANNDGNRPAETVGARVTWLLTLLHTYFRVVDLGLVVYPSDTMDANNYDGQTPADVLADCALKAGFNWFLYWDPGAQRTALFFDDSNTSTAYTSNLRISNVAADVDSDTELLGVGATQTWAPVNDAELTRSPQHVYSGVYIPWDGGATYRTRAATGSNFAFRDGPAPTSSVKTSAAAVTLGDRLLDDASTEADMISCTIRVPNTRVNDVRAGHRLSVKFSHLPGYEDWRWCRVLTKTTRNELRSDIYEIDLTLSPQCTGLEIVNSHKLTQETSESLFYLAFGFTATAGNILIACGSRRDGSTDVNPTGFTRWPEFHRPEAPAFGDDAVLFWYKVATGGEWKLDIWGTGSGSTGHIWELSGTTIESLLADFGTIGTGSPRKTPALAVPGSGIVLGYFSGLGDGEYGFNTITIPPWVLDYNESTDFHPHIGAFHTFVSSAGTYQPESGVSAGSFDGYGYTIFLAEGGGTDCG